MRIENVRFTLRSASAVLALSATALIASTFLANSFGWAITVSESNLGPTPEDMLPLQRAADVSFEVYLGFVVLIATFGAWFAKAPHHRWYRIVAMWLLWILGTGATTFAIAFVGINTQIAPAYGIIIKFAAVPIKAWTGLGG